MPRYVELVEKAISNRGNVVEVGTVTIYPRDFEAYSSLFSLNKDILDHVKDKKSVTGYEGRVSARIVWIDFDDAKNLPRVKENVSKFLTKLLDDYGVNPETVHIYFSGNKGFHIGIPAKMIGIEGESSDTLPAEISKFVKAISDGIECVDYKIYNHTRIFRLPYSLNAKSGMYKIGLPFRGFHYSSIEQIKEYAKECRIVPLDIRDTGLNNKLRTVFLKCQEDKKQKATAVKETVKQSIFKIPLDGSRNDILYKQAYRLFKLSDIKTDEVFDIMNIIYERMVSLNGSGFPHREFIALLNSAYKSARLNKVSSIRMNTMENLIYNAFDSIKNSEYAPTGFKDFDEDLGGGFKVQNVYSLIGKAGTKKSLVAQSIAIHNAINFDSPVIYFNMEMSSSQIFKRVFKTILKRDIEAEIKEGALDEDDLQGAYDDLNRALKNNFYVVDNSNLSTKDFADVISQVEENRDKKVKLIIVDSMNMMEAKGGNEVWTALENSKQMKELAKDSKVSVLTVNHVTSSCPEHLRDSALYARGGQKIKDNLDGWICLSKIIDTIKSSRIGSDAEDIVYKKELVYLRYFNKRESGETIDKVVQLEDNLEFKVLADNPKSFEAYDKK